jgi:hypothetical protein
MFCFIIFSVYREDLYLPLINTLYSCSHSNSVIFLGLTRQFSKPLFFEVLRKSFTFTLVPQHALSTAYGVGSGNEEIGLFILQKIELS